MATQFRKDDFLMAIDVVSTDLPVSTELALDRTRLAYERTLMAWIRTATSLITFGFTIYKFFQYLVERGQGVQRDRLIGPRGYGLLMIGIGLFALLLATISHRRNMQALRRKHVHVPYSLAAVLAAAISLLGIFALIVVIFRQ
jgi:putative membrane protein